MVEVARALNPDIAILVRSHNDDEADLLRKEGAGMVFVGEEELANGMSGHILAQYGKRERRTADQ